MRGLLFRNYPDRQEASRNVTKLSEVGIGVNRSISSVTGLALRDEKIYGSVHIAFGLNDQLGGRIRGALHYDLTILNPTLSSDVITHPIVAKGRVAILSEDVEPDWSKAQPIPERAAYLRLTGALCSLAPDTGELILEWRQVSGPESRSRVGNHETSVLAGKVYSLIPPMGISQADLLDKMQSRWSVPADASRRAVAVLASYKIVAVKSRRPRHNHTKAFRVPGEEFDHH